MLNRQAVPGRYGGVPSRTAPNWVLIIALALAAPFVWTVGPVLSFFLVVATVLLPFLAFITAPLAGLVGTMLAMWTTLALRESGAFKAYLGARQG